METKIKTEEVGAPLNAPKKEEAVVDLTITTDEVTAEQGQSPAITKKEIDNLEKSNEIVVENKNNLLTSSVDIEDNKSNMPKSISNGKDQVLTPTNNIIKGEVSVDNVKDEVSVDKVKDEVSVSVDNIKDEPISVDNVKDEVSSVNTVEDKAPESVCNIQDKVPVSVDNTQDKVPVSVDNTQDKVPASVDNTQDKVPVSVDNTQNKVPVSVDNTQDKIPVSVDNTQDKIPVSVDNTQDKVSVSVDNTQDNVPVSVDNTQDKVPVSVDNIQNKEPISVDNIQNKVTVAVVNTQDKEPVSVDNIQDKVPESVCNIQDKVPVSVDNTQDKVPVSDDNIQDKLPVSVDNTQDKVSVDNIQDKVPISVDNAKREGTKVLPPKSKKRKKSEKVQAGTDKPKESSRQRLSGAARKRFKWLLEKGHTHEEARTLAVIPMGSDRGLKRIFDSPESKPASKKQKPSVADTTPKSTKSLQGYKIPTIASISSTSKKIQKYGILAKKYPDELLTKDQLKMIEATILERIVSQKQGEVKPKFVGTTFKSGFMIISCADKATGVWLYNTIGQMKPWAEAELKTVRESEIPHSEVFSAFFYGSEDDSNETILGFIGAQNDGLNVKEWQVISRNASKNGVNMVFSVDLKSIINLRKQDFKINYKFGRVPIKGKILQKYQQKSVSHGEKKKAHSSKPSKKSKRPGTRPRPLPKHDSWSMVNRGEVGSTSRVNPSIFFNR